eukprot:s619_g4.t1
MVLAIVRSPSLHIALQEDLRVLEDQYPPSETPLETAWTFWYDKKTSDRKESEQYMEGLKQLGSFNTVEGFYRYYSYLLRPSDLPRDHNVLLFRKGYRPMWEEFPEGGCWIIRIKRKASQNYVNRMWENLLLAFIGEEFELPDVVGCVLSTRLKDDVLSVWNLTNRDNTARFRIGEKLKEVLGLDMNALIQSALTATHPVIMPSPMEEKMKAMLAQNARGGKSDEAPVKERALAVAENPQAGQGVETWDGVGSQEMVPQGRRSRNAGQHTIEIYFPQFYFSQVEMEEFDARPERKKGAVQVVFLS